MSLVTPNVPKSGSAACPHCQAFVRPENLDSHIRLRCPKALAVVIAARPPKPKKSRQRHNPSSGKHIKKATGGHLTKDYERGLLKVAVAKFVRNQRDSMGD
jgi:hypothetical protein